MKPTRRTSAPRPLKPGWTSLITPKPQFTGCMPRKPMRAAPSNRRKPPICRGLLLFWWNSARFLRLFFTIRRRPKPKRLSIMNKRLSVKRSSSRAAMFPTRRRRKASAIPNPKPSRRKPSAASTCRRRTGSRFRRICLFLVRRKRPSKPALPAFKSRCRLPGKDGISLRLSSLPRCSAMPSTR